MAKAKWTWSDDRGGFVANLPLPKLQAWRNRWQVGPSGVEGPFDEEHVDNASHAVEVVLLGRRDEDGFGQRRRASKPAKAQLAAYERLPQDDAALDVALASYLLTAATSGAGIGGVQLPDPADFDDPQQRLRIAQVWTPEGIRELFHLEGISILDEQRTGLAYVRLDFESDLDPEHGVAVVVYGTTPVGIGQMGDDDLGMVVDERADAVAAAESAVDFDAVKKALAAALNDPRNRAGIWALSAAAAELPAGRTLRVSLRIETPPVRRLERLHYASRSCQYVLSVDVGDSQTIVNVPDSPAQDYLRAGAWPRPLFAPILQWPALTPMWETVGVVEVDVAKSLRLRRTVETPRPDLREVAASAWRQGLDSQEAATRGVAPMEEY
jgi:hypothetical protein